MAEKMTAQKWNKKGDKESMLRQWSKAIISLYTKAIELETDDTEKGLYYDNRAAAYFEQGDYDKAIEDCDNVLKIFHNAPVTLFRRFLALLELERFEEAFEMDQDEKILSSCSNDTLARHIAAQFEIPHIHIKEKVSQMMDLAINLNADKEKRENAMISLLRLACWRTDAYKIFIKKVGENDEVIRSALRIVGELCKNNISRIKSTMIKVVLPWCLEMMNSTSTEKVNASQYCLQNILNIYSGMNDEPDSKPDEALCEKHNEVIDKILSCLLDKIENKTTTGLARDALIEFITRNIHYTALNWAKRLVKFDGLQKLMVVASQLEECQDEYSLNITSSTQAVTSVCLAKIYEKLCRKKDKEKFVDIVDEFIGEKYDPVEVISQVRTVVVMTTLTLGPFKIADAILKDGFDLTVLQFLEKNGNNLLLRRVFCEFIYAVVTKHDNVNTFIKRSLKILQDLCYPKDNSKYLDDSKHLMDFEELDDSENLNSIRIRAFVGICKMTKFRNIKNFPVVHMFNDKQIMTWLEVCLQFLINPQRNMRKWAVEGLSYLTFDLKVKNELIEDQRAVQAIIEFIKTENQPVLYQVDILLVNLCSAYDKEDLIIERETFVDYFNVENHIFAKDSFVGKRRCVLAHAGVTSALVSLAKTDNRNSKELIARVFNAICSEQDLRLMVVQEDGTETLLSLALDSTDIGKTDATRALIYLALTVPPKVAFPGQIMMGVVRLIIDLLKSKYSRNENCETPIALRDLSVVINSIHSDAVQNKEIKKLASLALKAIGKWQIQEKHEENESSLSTDNMKPSVKRIKRK